MELGTGSILAIVIVVALRAALFIAPFAALYWLLTRTRRGRHFIGQRAPGSSESMTLEVADQLRGLQAQLDDAHSRLDFAERVMLEQREQLRVLGAPEPLVEIREPTPV